MKAIAINKVTSVILGTTGALLLLGGTNGAVAANLTASSHHDMTSTEVSSLVAFNVDRLDPTLVDEANALVSTEIPSSSGMNKWIASIYYLMMMHLILSFILASKGEEA